MRRGDSDQIMQDLRDHLLHVRRRVTQSAVAIDEINIS